MQELVLDIFDFFDRITIKEIEEELIARLKSERYSALYPSYTPFVSTQEYDEGVRDMKRQILRVTERIKAEVLMAAAFYLSNQSSMLKYLSDYLDDHTNRRHIDAGIDLALEVSAAFGLKRYDKEEAQVLARSCALVAGLFYSRNTYPEEVGVADYFMLKDLFLIASFRQKQSRQQVLMH